MASCTADMPVQMRVPRLTSEMLLAVRAVAEHRTFKRAGLDLGLSASAVYKKVRSAGNLFGRRLFVRTAEGVMLTETGRILNRAGEHTLEHLLLTEETTTAFVKLEDGRLLVGHSTYLPPKLLALVLKLSLGGPEPKRIEHSSGLTTELIRSVIEGRIHAGFGFLPLSHPALLVRQLYEEPLVVCMPRSHPLVVKPEVRPEDLIGERIIAVSRVPLPHLHQEIQEHFDQLGVTLQIAADALAPPEAQTMTDQGLGICLIARSSLTHRSLVGISLSTRLLTRKSGMFIREDNHHPTLKTFVELVMASALADQRNSATNRLPGR